MDRITVGLDFGTHQTKVCIENKADVNNPEYSFFPFKDLNGDDTFILPSIVQINSDNTLSYGFVDLNRVKYGKKFFVGGMPKYPQKVTIEKEKMVPVPERPKILSTPAPSDPSALSNYKIARAKAQKSYDTQLLLWKHRKEALEAKYERTVKEIEAAYKEELKEWYRWQNSSQTDYRLIYRYFKQNTFSDYKWNCALASSYLSIWYISYILFCLEEKYGQSFAIQMGIPTGSDNFEQKKRKAVSLLLTAYHLVEDVFNNDKEKFLSTTIQELERLTKPIAYSEEKKQEYSLLVFPEAYAALKSITAQKRIESGMSLMVDIGGGTTDITFFTVEDDKPRIYDYSSIPYGLNYIIETATPNIKDKYEADLNLNNIEKVVLKSAVDSFYQNLTKNCNGLVSKLKRSFERTGFPISKLTDALKKRVVIYSGGGSTYSILRKNVLDFSDIKQISPAVWQGMRIKDASNFAKICPIVSTALGLSISELNDEVQLSTTNDIFKHLEGIYQVEEKPKPRWV